MEPEVDLAPTNVETGSSGVAVNFDGSAASAEPVAMSCPVSRHSVANATVNRLMSDLLRTQCAGRKRGAHSCAPERRGVGGAYDVPNTESIPY
jgi:hypothetical protein